MGIYWMELFTRVTLLQMEAQDQDLTWHSDHTSQEVLDLTIRQATTGATAENPIEIDSDSDCSSITETEWAEYFAAGADRSEEPLDDRANAIGADYDHCNDGNVHLLPSIGTGPAMLNLSHQLRINLTRTPTILYCTKCPILTDKCLTDAQIKLVTYWLMPQLHRSIIRGSGTMYSKMKDLRMIVRLFMMDTSGVDKIGHCLHDDLISGLTTPWSRVADLRPDSVPYYTVVPSARSRDLEHFD